MGAMTKQGVIVADAVWLATALLHREHPLRPDFTVNEIAARAGLEGIVKQHSGLYRHVLQHCVANRPPNPFDYRMLYETKSKNRRLFRMGDLSDLRRKGKIVPAANEIPLRYAYLLDWYERWSHSSVETAVQEDPLLALYGSGRDLWADEHADEYVTRLRAGWR
jgi:hypothetical protein